MRETIGVPQADEAAPYYFTYINRIPGGDVLNVLEQQVSEAAALLHGISEDKSLYRYAKGKWTIREAWNHVNDAERVFVYRALWFARRFEGALPSFDQDIGVAGAQADTVSWGQHIDEFLNIRKATISFFRNLPAGAWNLRGTASGNSFTVRALAYIIAGHVSHHMAILRERYL